MSFPRLRITADGLEAQGAFAEAQAAYLSPDPTLVARLGQLLRDKQVGVVAHFYMDPELQGALVAAQAPFVHVSDSLVMADRAVDMAKHGAKSVVVLGVDFMSENVRAMLDASGFAHVPVYRVASDPIGCSLAEAAEADAYYAYLTKAAQQPRALHVVYINTSLATKAKAQAIVPTITCTSSNVVSTILTAFAQIDGAHVFFGPDTYMGQNLERMLAQLGDASDETVRKVHPAHDAASIRALRPRFHIFERGNCIVHHMFGAEVVRRVRAQHPDAFITAHLEVPGEMFELALERREQGRGVVGSTSDILTFIDAKVREAATRDDHEKLEFVLGTEAGMITSIVRRVQATLRELSASEPSREAADIAADIVFPVAAEAIAATDDRSLPVVPGPAGGEGCSTAGGCATCPYMKMNSLDALLDLLARIDVVPQATLAPLYPKQYTALVDGQPMAALGTVPILHMRAFQHDKQLPKALVDDVLTRHARASDARP